MKKALFSFFCLFILSGTAVSQEKDSVRTGNFSLALRGKVIGFFIVEDLYFATATLGCELTYRNKHSLGIDATWFRWRNQRDDMEDNAMYSEYERKVYLYFDYKFTFGSWRCFDFYLNAYEKTGQYKSWFRGENYELIGDTAFLRSKTNGTFNEFGLGLGAKTFFGDSRFGIDLSANVAKRYSNNTMYQATNPVSLSQAKIEAIGFYMRLNLFWRVWG